MIGLLVGEMTVNQPISVERRVTSADRTRTASLDRYLRYYREDNRPKQDGWSEHWLSQRRLEFAVARCRLRCIEFIHDNELLRLFSLA